MRLEKEKLLIVENDPLVTRAVEKAAAALNLLPVRATDGWDAIRKLETSEYYAAVIDSDLPEQSSYGFLRYVKEEFGEDTLTRVLVLTNDEQTAGRLKSEHIQTLQRTEAVDELTIAIRSCER